MKHIKDILAQRQVSLFDRPAGQQGSREWSAFNAVVGDRVDAYPTSSHTRPEVRYTNVVKIRRIRNPHSLFPRHAN